MKPSRFNQIREKLGLTWDEWGRALGYGGSSPKGNIHRFMKGERLIPRYLARLARMYERYGIPRDIDKDDGV